MTASRSCSTNRRISISGSDTATGAGCITRFWPFGDRPGPTSLEPTVYASGGNQIPLPTATTPCAVRECLTPSTGEREPTSCSAMPVTIGVSGTAPTWRLRRRPGQVAASQQHRGDVRNHVAPDRRTLTRRMQGHARRFRQVIRGAEPAHARCEATAGEGPSSASREAATKNVASAPCFCRARQRRGPARPRVPDWSARTRVLRSFAGLSCADAIVPVGRRRR
jgi:hypothetical protein